MMLPALGSKINVGPNEPVRRLLPSPRHAIGWPPGMRTLITPDVFVCALMLALAGCDAERPQGLPEKKMDQAEYKDPPIAPGCLELDGRTFVIAHKGVTGTPSWTDSLVFDDQRVTSPVNETMGFKPEPFACAEKDGTSVLSWDMTSPDHGVVHWSGTVQGDSIRGSSVWQNAGTPEVKMEFSGRALALTNDMTSMP